MCQLLLADLLAPELIDKLINQNFGVFVNIHSNGLRQKIELCRMYVHYKSKVENYYIITSLPTHQLNEYSYASSCKLKMRASHFSAADIYG